MTEKIYKRDTIEVFHMRWGEEILRSVYFDLKVKVCTTSIQTKFKIDKLIIWRNCSKKGMTDINFQDRFNKY